jgi:hypothetical protein
MARKLKTYQTSQGFYTQDARLVAVRGDVMRGPAEIDVYLTDVGG